MVDRLAHDMSDHFKERLHTLIYDTLDTCLRVDMDEYIAAAVIVNGLLQEAVIGSFIMQMTEKDYIDICLFARRAATKALKAAGKKPKERSK